VRHLFVAAGILAGIGVLLCLSAYYHPAAVDARRAEALYSRSLQLADNMDRSMDPARYNRDRARVYREERLREEYRRY
jgi:hypothetical protein